MIFELKKYSLNKILAAKLYLRIFRYILEMNVGVLLTISLNPYCHTQFIQLKRYSILKAQLFLYFMKLIIHSIFHKLAYMHSIFLYTHAPNSTNQHDYHQI